MTRAAERLGLAVQTVSAQLASLEQSVGKSLFRPQGRRLVLTEAGQVALRYADQIFLLGEQLLEALADVDLDKTLRLTVGISDSLPKLIASKLLESALTLPQPVRLICFEEQFDTLLGKLSVHKIDVMLTDRPVPPGSALRVFSHLLGEFEIGWFGLPVLADRYREGFPASLQGAPLLLPTRNNALRGRIDQWLNSHDLTPNIFGEFDDNALLNTFGQQGRGLFPAPTALAADVRQQLGAVPVGPIPQVREQIYALSNERKIQHPGIAAILNAMPPEVLQIRSTP